MGDPEARFRVYKTYICLITDLATCINLHNEETDRVAYGVTNPTSTATTNADDRATTTTGQTERLEEANGGRRIGGGLTEQSGMLVLIGLSEHLYTRTSMSFALKLFKSNKFFFRNVDKQRCLFLLGYFNF